ncbi:multiple epidermal growth factor-like domains protein 10 [Haliotis cracherodii]|uniref:multiple epidermal growth factor-like domains protein 10 n=1 Tax=Haliotis cracherodii TaxID=6455 RepID=UPI0039E7DF43
MGNMCTEGCADGYFGVNCNDSCGKCKGGVVCDKADGRCASGYETGWIGYNCTQEIPRCPPGTHGKECQVPCGHCLDDRPCMIDTGRCPSGCQPGWMGNMCTEGCADGYFGVNCNDSCGKCKGGVVCDKADGRCASGCETGWIGYNCTQEIPVCPPGTHGKECQVLCGHCRDDGPCMSDTGRCPSGCQPGWMGNMCTEVEVIVLITDHNGYIYKMDANSQGILYHDQQGTEDIAYDPVEEQIYWSNLDTHSVSRLNLDGGNYMKLFDVQKSQGIVLDPRSRILFYSDDRTAVIGKYHLKTRVEEVIVRSDLSRPHALAADTQRRKLYWSDIGNSPRIEVADYNGNDRETLVQSHLIWPTSLVLDKTGDNLYWVDEHGSLNDVMALNLSTRTSRSILYTGRRREFFDLDVYNDTLYFIDREETNHDQRESGMRTHDHRILACPRAAKANSDWAICTRDIFKFQDARLVPMGRNAKCRVDIVETIGPILYLHDIECPDGSHGDDCHVPCGHCSDNIPCNKTDGLCPSGCAAGWTRPHCTRECSDGSHGADCHVPCGHCSDNIPCDKTDGLCPRGCAAGWTMPHCTRGCKDGYFGDICEKSCGHCVNGIVCDKADGRCASGCEAGWFGYNCTQECTYGYFGVNCNQSCGQCMGGVACDKGDGRCVSGCATGWIGYNCTHASTPLETDSHFNLILVVVCVCAAAAVLLVTALGIYTYRLRKSSIPNTGFNTRLCKKNRHYITRLVCSLRMNRHRYIGTLCGIIILNTIITGSQGDVIVLISDHNGPIYKVNTSSRNTTVVFRDVSGVENIAYDPVREHVYWSNLQKRNIQRIDLSGGNHVTVFSVRKCQGLAIAPESRLLFYSDDGSDIIGKYDLKTGRKTVIIRSNLGRAHDVTVDEFNRKLFWSDVGSDPKIEMSNYDGGNRVTLVRALSGSSSTPTSLAVDEKGENLYWVDEQKHRSEIMVLRLNQTTARSIPYGERSDFFSLDLFNKTLYLIDLRQRNVFLSVPVTGGSVASTPIPRGMSDYRSIRVFSYPYKCTDGYFGDNCEGSCGHCLSGAVCDKADGRCASGCEAGWFGYNCTQECTDGYFGDNCEGSCGHCLSGAVCDKADGRCASGCEAGWFGYNCTQECTDGYFGDNCEGSCGHCLSGAVCDKADGRCASGCEAGWFGYNCTQECTVAYFGVNCEEACGHCRGGASCDKSDGGCVSGCEDGWIGYNCSQAGCDGKRCDLPCSNCSQQLDCGVAGNCSSPLTTGHTPVPVVAGVCGAAVAVGVLAVVLICRRSRQTASPLPPKQGDRSVMYRIMEDIQDANTSGEGQLIQV